MDTEGLYSNVVGDNHDMNIFLIAILTCTSFIYNSQSTIDEKALDQLATIAELACN